MTVEASGAAASASSGRDDYGFPTDDAPQGVSEFPEERDEMEVVLSPASGEDDDRTPEERELDARAARMAHSLEKPVSPSGKKTGGRAPRGTGAARGRRPAGPRASGAEAKASAPRRGGRPRSGGSSEGAAPAARSRRPAGAAPRRRRKSE
jgi:hypothetical protein